MWDYYKVRNLGLRHETLLRDAKYIKQPAKKKAYEKRCQVILDTIKSDANKAEALMEKLDKEREKYLVPKEPKPEVGKDIYVPTRMYIDHGEDDVLGGLAKITNVSVSISAGEPCWFIEVKEIPGSFNYAMLLERQAEYKKEYKRQRAKPDPDYG